MTMYSLEVFMYRLLVSLLKCQLLPAFNMNPTFKKHKHAHRDHPQHTHTLPPRRKNTPNPPKKQTSQENAHIHIKKMENRNKGKKSGM